MRRPLPGEYGASYQHYMDLTRGADFLQNLEDSSNSFLEFLDELPENLRNYAYADNKWTVSQMVQHLADTDMVFTSRALWLVRNEGGELPGFDHDLWAENSLKSNLNWEEMTLRFRDFRSFMLSLFHSFHEDQLDIKGTINGNITAVRSIPFILAGHTFHHLHILKERYL